ncbi:MAG: zinc-dependent metalloprotease [Solirubrobacteraceae bacterium]
MIDWSVAERVAGFVAGAPPDSPPAAAGRMAELAHDAERRVLAYTGMQLSSALPMPEALNRQQWIEANLRSMRPIIEPLTARVGANLGALAAPARLLTGLVMAAQVGALTGYLAGRVLGQYEIALLDSEATPRLLMVSPNLAEAAEKLRADPEELVDWVAFHEVTHAVQFSSVPWLRDHLAGLLRELLGSLEVRLDGSRAMKLPGLDDLRGIVEALREGDLISLTIGRERRALVDQVQAAMALIEGHAEHVMDAVGAEVLPSQAALREAMERRRDGRAGPLRLLDRLLGMELKLRQYRDGKRFVDRVVETGGMGALNRAWSAPGALPTLAELADPTAWMARTAVPFVTK